jgi:iron(III) transport system permease protein
MKTFFSRMPLGRLTLGLVVFSVLAGYVVWPQLLVYGLAFGVGDESGPSLETWRQTLASPLARRAVWNSVFLSLLSVVAAGVLGTGTALLCEKWAFPGRRLIFAASVLPLALPPLVGVMAFGRLIGLGGIIPQALAHGLPKAWAEASGWRAGDFALLDLPAILAMHAYSFSVYFFALTRAGLAHLDGSLDRAARSLGAGPWRRFARVTLPALAPHLTGAALITFMLSMGSYSAPYYLSSNRAKHPYLTIEIADRHDKGQDASAAVLATLLSAICLGTLAAMQLGLRSAWRQDAGGAKGTGADPSPPRLVRGRGARMALGTLSGLYFAVMAAPPAVILLTSLADIKAWNRAGTILPPVYTLASHIEVFREAFFEPRVHAHPLVVSLMAGVVAAALNVAMAVATALLMARGGRTVRLGADLLSTLPLALPGTVVAFNLATAFFGAGSVWTLGFSLRGTFTILALTYFIRQIPTALRPINASMAQVDPTLEAAARSLGAGAPANVFPHRLAAAAGRHSGGGADLLRQRGGRVRRERFGGVAAVDAGVAGDRLKASGFRWLGASRRRSRFAHEHDRRGAGRLCLADAPRQRSERFKPCAITIAWVSGRTDLKTKGYGNLAGPGICFAHPRLLFGSPARFGAGSKV